jgi:hypothetical protein
VCLPPLPEHSYHSLSSPPVMVGECRRREKRMGSAVDVDEHQPAAKVVQCGDGREEITLQRVTLLSLSKHNSLRSGTNLLPPSDWSADYIKANVLL